MSATNWRKPADCLGIGDALDREFDTPEWAITGRHWDLSTGDGYSRMFAGPVARIEIPPRIKDTPGSVIEVTPRVFQYADFPTEQQPEGELSQETSIDVHIPAGDEGLDVEVAVELANAITAAAELIQTPRTPRTFAYPALLAALKAHREALSDEDIATWLDITPGQVRDLLNGDVAIDVDQLVSLSQLLGVSPGDLIEAAMTEEVAR